MTTPYRLFHNLGRDRWYGYIPDAPLWVDPTTYTIPSDNGNRLDAIYARHNRDDRPDGRIAPSLSVGDVIAVYPAAPDDTPDPLFYAVADIGFAPIATPTNVITSATWREACDRAA